MLITLSGDRSIGIMRQGLMLPTANLRYRLRSMELLPNDKKPTVTMVLTHSDQATRRAIRTLGDYTHHSGTFVAPEGKFLAGDHQSLVWQICGTSMNDKPPVVINPNVTLAKIVTGIDQMLETSYIYKLATGNVSPDPDDLYTSRLRATMPEPSEQFTSSLAVQLTAAEKETLDLLASWPVCTKELLAGLMGGVTRRRVNQVLCSLAHRSLVRADGKRHVLTDDGLRYLARRDRASVGAVLGRWSAYRRKRGDNNTSAYRGSSLRAMASQLNHHYAVTGIAAVLSAETARSQGYELLDLQPTSRSPIGYNYLDTNYVVHPDAAFLLGYWGQWRDCLLEFERRATTPKRVRARLRNYRRYFQSGWADRDHGGDFPLVLFVFETPKSENAFRHIAATADLPSLLTANNETLTQRGVLGDAWRTSASKPQKRVALQSFFRVAKMQLAAPRDSCREGPVKAEDTATNVVRPYSRKSEPFVADSGATTASEINPSLAAAGSVR